MDFAVVLVDIAERAGGGTEDILLLPIDLEVKFQPFFQTPRVEEERKRTIIFPASRSSHIMLINPQDTHTPSPPPPLNHGVQQTSVKPLTTHTQLELKSQPRALQLFSPNPNLASLSLSEVSHVYHLSWLAHQSTPPQIDSKLDNFLWIKMQRHEQKEYIERQAERRKPDADLDSTWKILQQGASIRRLC